MTHKQFTDIYLPLSGKMYALAYNLLRNRDERIYNENKENGTLSGAK